jgi:hypothetical protein
MDLKRSQLVECIVQLAKRAEELQEQEISVVLFTLAGSCLNKDDALAELADLCNLLARNRLLKMMAEEAGEQGTPLQ